MSENIKEEFKVDALKQISNSSLKSEAPVINVGDTVKVHVRITEGDSPESRYSRAQLSLRSTVESTRHSQFVE